MPGRRLSAAAVGAAFLLPAVAACGGASSSAGTGAGGGVQATSAPGTITVTRTATGGVTGGATASRPPTAMPTTSLSRCDGPSLTIAVGAPDGAAGTVYRTIVFRNGGPRTCTLKGYPGVAAADAAGKAVVNATRDTSRAPERVVLAPAGSAHAVLAARNLPSGSAACETYAQLLVTPPDSRRTSTIPVSVTPCERVLRVGPVLAGATPG